MNWNALIEVAKLLCFSILSRPMFCYEVKLFVLL